MAVSTSTSSPLPFLFLHRAAANPTPINISFPSSPRASSLRSRAAAAPPAETLSDEGLPDAPPEGEGTGIPLSSSIGDDGEQPPSRRSESS
uniref:Pco139549 n=1 Tax=Arundo donax TaxID=35708 RepID=A0A0A9E7N3_ARUDO